jgi:hypothetical protein
MNPRPSRTTHFAKRLAPARVSRHLRESFDNRIFKQLAACIAEQLYPAFEHIGGSVASSLMCSRISLALPVDSITDDQKRYVDKEKSQEISSR